MALGTEAVRNGTDAWGHLKRRITRDKDNPAPL
jgi:hypothetical protein